MTNFLNLILYKKDVSSPAISPIIKKEKIKPILIRLICSSLLISSKIGLVDIKKIG
jgi:hypothetical protein